MIFQLILLATSGVFLIRSVLIITGRLKDPVLRHFERYGPQEMIFQPVPGFLIALGMFTFLLNEVLVTATPVVLISALLIATGVLLLTNPQFARRHPRVFLRYPLWLWDLSERTSRYERRRIAYMWLRLPRKLRAVYNSNDLAFQEWADFIILGTLL